MTIGIGQFRGDTRNYVRRALAGETFRVTRRGRPILNYAPRTMLTTQATRGSR
jgi:antitoxin (DNA-binding transcriptional repressor) of toxin-antitoxin stability system